MTIKNTASNSNDNKPPKLIADRYKIISKLGEGGMGIVYKANDPLLNDTVSIKILKNIGAMEESAIRFHREAKAASKLSHPNLATVLDFGAMQDGNLYMVSKFIDGETIKARIKSKGPFSLEDGISVIYQIADCMTYIHSKGILHRDLKAGNVIISEEEQNTKAFVLDFGIAKLIEQHVVEEGVTNAGTVLGSPHYMSPEQGLGLDVDFRSDVYSLGCLAYEIFSGKVPFESDTLFNIIKMHSEEPPPKLDSLSNRDDIPQEIQNVLLHMLAKEPENRIQTMAEVRDIFSELLETFAPKHSWTVESDVSDEPRSLIQNWSNFTSKSKSGTKIIVSLFLLIIAGIACTQLTKWINSQFQIRETSESQSKEAETEMSFIKDGFDSLLQKEASIMPMKDNFKSLKGYKTYYVISNKKEKMPDWSQLENTGQKIFLLIQAPAIKLSDLKNVLALKDLKVFSLSINSGITGKEFEEILKRSDLEGLEFIRSKDLTAHEYSKLTQFPNLSYLEFDDCDMNREKIAQIAKIKNLTFLTLKNEHNLKEDSIDPLANNKSNLKILNIKRTDLPDQALTSIAKLKRLKTLILNSTPVGDSGIIQLVKNRSNIKNLQITNTRISHTGFLSLSKLKNLHEVYVGDNKNFSTVEAEQLARTVKFKTTVEKTSAEEYSSLFGLSPHD